MKMRIESLQGDLLAKILFVVLAPYDNDIRKSRGREYIKDGYPGLVSLSDSHGMVAIGPSAMGVHFIDSNGEKREAGRSLSEPTEVGAAQWVSGDGDWIAVSWTADEVIFQAEGENTQASWFSSAIRNALTALASNTACLAHSTPLNVSDVPDNKPEDL